MFTMIHDNDKFELPDVPAVIDAVAKLRDTSITVLDQRENGSCFHLSIEASGAVHETYGSRLIVRNISMLLETPGKPVYC